MIVVTLGTQRFQMNRLIEAIDGIAPAMSEEFFVQTGNSTYIPQHCRYQNFLDAEEFQKKIEECSLLITHAGVGTIMRGINAGKPVVVIPRLARYHEHVDDHQVQIAKAFAGKECVLCCEDLDHLSEVIEEARVYPFKPYKSPDRKIEDIILEFIHQLD